LRETLQKRLGLPVVLDNDANCAAWGEYRYGAGRGSRNMCYVTFSTGCGMGIIIEGRLYRGSTGTAGEIGHTVVNPDGPLCSCGKRGCLMSYACGMALDQMARDSLNNGEDTLIRALCGDYPEHIPAEKIAEAAMQGDAVCRPPAQDRRVLFWDWPVNRSPGLEPRYHCDWGWADPYRSYAPRPMLTGSQRKHPPGPGGYCPDRLVRAVERCRCDRCRCSGLGNGLCLNWVACPLRLCVGSSSTSSDTHFTMGRVCAPTCFSKAAG